ncbi:MAG: aldehyde dehydrogenase family protein [Gemmatimonadetes bacterium]|nr:aldehyde dehydrogenase family protein [Gemmatimonadota bacterium]NIO33235.1 aldehyde dehydrogenase family protein [Gemmatimonadota bacterium]
MDVELQTRLFIGNEFVGAADGSTFEVENPAEAETLAEVAEAKQADIDRAVAAARRAFESDEWQGLAARERGRLLNRLADLVEEKADELARIETLQNGKPYFESRQVDLPELVAILRYYAGWADKIHGETIPVAGPVLNYTRREPLGVVGAIVPWNFPLLLAVWKVAPALACGNTVVLKPAEEAPLTALKLGELAAQVGFPAGALNVVPGYGPTAGAPLVRHAGVDKIAFTGSTEVGKQIMCDAAVSLKPVTLELGGKSPNIVFADADLKAAVRGVTTGIFYGKGEVCAAGSRLFVESSIHDQFVEQLVDRAKKMTPGDPFDKNTRLGAIVSERQLDRVLGYVERGREEGAELLTGGSRLDRPGYFVDAAVFDGVRPEMTIAQEEIFGPVLAALTFDDVDEAIALGNQTIYGLAAGVWTQDVKKAHRVAHGLRAGTVWVNTYNRYDPAAPFGGYKQSGFGRDLGMHALEGYTQVKNIWIDLS